MARGFTDWTSVWVVEPVVWRPSLSGPAAAKKKIEADKVQNTKRPILFMGFPPPTAATISQPSRTNQARSSPGILEPS
jgi:hypothetical protein